MLSSGLLDLKHRDLVKSLPTGGDFLWYRPLLCFAGPGSRGMQSAPLYVRTFDTFVRSRRFRWNKGAGLNDRKDSEQHSEQGCFHPVYFHRRVVLWVEIVRPPYAKISSMPGANVLWAGLLEVQSTVLYL